MNKHFLTGALAMGTVTLASVVAANPAEALELGFGGDLGFFSGLTVDGLSVTASGRTTLGESRSVVQSDAGLGVWNGSLFQREDGSFLPDFFQVDGLGPDEILQLSFNKEINLLTATFSRVGFDDHYKLIWDDGKQSVEGNIPGGSLFDVAVGKVAFSEPYPSGSIFNFTVRDWNDDYFLKALSVEVSEVTPVPTPAAVLPGLMGMGAAVFRKKKQGQEEPQEV